MTADFNADWAAMKNDYAAHEAAQERAAYAAKMERDDALLTDTRRPNTDSWSLRVQREAKAARDAAGEPIPELDSYLALCEAAAAETGITRDEDTTRPEAPRTGGGNGSSNYGAANAPSEAQLRFLTSLSRDLGRELDTPRDKRHASLIIDGAKKALDAARRSGATPAARPERKATERQVEFLAALLAERAHDLGELDPAGLSAARASELIDTLTRAPRAKVAAHGIREGRYAYQPADGSAASFYRVTRTGRIRVVAGPSEHPYNGKLNAALEWIKAEPKAAAALYGQLLGSCGRCGLTLTDEDSRARGLGPVCAGKTEW